MGGAGSGAPGMRRERVKCGVCGCEGVNRRTCPGTLAEHEALVRPRIFGPMTPAWAASNGAAQTWGSLRSWSGESPGHLGPLTDDLPDPIDVEEILSIIEVSTTEPATIAESLERIALALEAIVDVLGA